MNQRKGDWFHTYSGKQFYPLDPRVDDICIRDIAHHLSLVCRFGGAVRAHYSVAQHSLMVADILPQHLKLQGLLHDATEAYVGDMVRPLKQSMPEYCKVEKSIWDAIVKKFSLPVEISVRDMGEIKWADNTALMTEKRDLLLHFPHDWSVKESPLSNPIVPMSSCDAEIKFLEAFDEISVAQDFARL